MLYLLPGLLLLVSPPAKGASTSLSIPRLNIETRDNIASPFSKAETAFEITRRLSRELKRRRFPPPVHRNFKPFGIRNLEAKAGMLSDEHPFFFPFQILPGMEGQVFVFSSHKTIGEMHAFDRLFPRLAFLYGAGRSRRISWVTDAELLNQLVIRIHGENSVRFASTKSHGQEPHEVVFNNFAEGFLIFNDNPLSYWLAHDRQHLPGYLILLYFPEVLEPAVHTSRIIRDLLNDLQEDKLFSDTKFSPFEQVLTMLHLPLIAQLYQEKRSILYDLDDITEEIGNYFFDLNTIFRDDKKIVFPSNINISFLLSQITRLYPHHPSVVAANLSEWLTDWLDKMASELPDESRALIMQRVTSYFEAEPPQARDALKATFARRLRRLLFEPWESPPRSPKYDVPLLRSA